MVIPPWADRRSQIEAAEFERVVSALLTEAGRDLAGFRVEHRELVRTPDGDYRIDVTTRFTQLGADFLVLVECKDHARPVERQDVQVLFDKVRAAGAQKGMLFSTNGFQKGAIEYARSHGIALVRMSEGALTYETRTLGTEAAPVPPWVNVPKYVGQLISLNDDGNWQVSLVETGRVNALSGFLASVAHGPTADGG
jgi:restriction system protein